jgi:nucleoside-diphosphate-sugar epimerase
VKSMRYFITGASGFLGYHICRYLLELDQVVKGLDIADFDYPDLKNKVNFIKGDIRDKDLIKNTMAGTDVVIHCAAALPLWTKEETFSVNVDGTRDILQTAYELNIKKVVFISTTAIYGIIKNPPVDENYTQNSIGNYGESKIQAERICREFRQKGLCIPILRPVTFAGPMRLGVFQILCDWVKDKKNVPIIGSGNNKYQLLHVEDLVDVIYLVCTSSEDNTNDNFNVGSIKFNTMKNDVQALLDSAGFKKRVIPVPAWLITPVLKILAFLHLSPLYEWIYETAGEDHFVSTDKLQKRFNWSPKKTTADVWIDTYKWYCSEYETINMKTGISHRVAWKQGILKLVKLFF